VIDLSGNIGYIGGYGKGINVVSYDPQTGGLDIIQKDAGMPHASKHSYLSLSPSKKHLYSGCCFNGGAVMNNGCVMSFEIQEDGSLKELNYAASASKTGACHVFCGSKGLYASHYGDGRATVYHVNDDGSLFGPAQLIQFEGKGPHPQQDTAHIHFGAEMPDGYVCFVDLGLDSIYFYYHHPKTGDLILNSTARVPLGTGARHLLHKSGYVYVVSEMSAIVSIYQYRSGKMSYIASHSALPEGFSGKVASSAIRMFDDILIIGNRFLNEMAVFKANGDVLELKSHIPCLLPRDLNFSPDGNYVYVCGQEDDLIQIFKVDKSDFSLEPTGKTLSVERPSCIIFS
jgi:6-phosphogluconolactonase